MISIEIYETIESLQRRTVNPQLINLFKTNTVGMWHAEWHTWEAAGDNYWPRWPLDAPE